MDRCGEVRDCRLPHTNVGGNSERVICLVGDQTVMLLEHHERYKEDWGRSQRRGAMRMNLLKRDEIPWER